MLGVLVRGGFGAHDADVTADTLQAFAIGLVPFSVYLYTLRGFYALQDTRTPFLINAIENGVNIALAVVLFPSLGVQGLALAWSGAYSVAAVLALVAAAAASRRPGRPARSRVDRRCAPLVGAAALAIVAAVAREPRSATRLAERAAARHRRRRRSRAAPCLPRWCCVALRTPRARDRASPGCSGGAARCRYGRVTMGRVRTDRNASAAATDDANPRRSHGRSRRDRQCL